jgi:hypothetical protein
VLVKHSIVAAAAANAACGCGRIDLSSDGTIALLYGSKELIDVITALLNRCLIETVFVLSHGSLLKKSDR